MEGDPLDLILPNRRSKQIEPGHGDDEDEDEEPVGHYVLLEWLAEAEQLIVCDEEDGESKVGRSSTRN